MKFDFGLIFHDNLVLSVIGILMTCPLTGNLVLVDTPTRSDLVSRNVRSYNSMRVDVQGSSGCLAKLIGSVVLIHAGKFYIEHCLSQSSDTNPSRISMYELHFGFELKNCTVLCKSSNMGSAKETQSDDVRYRHLCFKWVLGTEVR